MKRHTNKIEKTAVAAVTVLYQPSMEDLLNLKTYSTQVAKLYIIDNSGRTNRSAIQRLLPSNDSAMWQYILLEENKGIAAAMNLGAQLARKDGFAYLLTMDQDTAVPEGTVDVMRGVFQRLLDGGERVGLVAAHAVAKASFPTDYQLPDSATIFIDFPLLVPTSGNLICLNAHRKVGGADDDYFIDDVDFEYCLRLQAAHYKIAWLPHLLVAHELGETTWHDFLWWKKIPAFHHNALRRYYITRNRCFTLKRYHGVFPQMKRLYWRMTWREWVSILLFERHRQDKIWAAMMAILHFANGKTGKRGNV